jgi:membrane protein required for beta-lactamase induction
MHVLHIIPFCQLLNTTVFGLMYLRVSLLVDVICYHFQAVSSHRSAVNESAVHRTILFIVPNINSDP